MIKPNKTYSVVLFLFLLSSCHCVLQGSYFIPIPMEQLAYQRKLIFQEIQTIFVFFADALIRQVEKRVRSRQLTGLKENDSKIFITSAPGLVSTF